MNRRAMLIVAIVFALAAVGVLAFAMLRPGEIPVDVSLDTAPTPTASSAVGEQPLRIAVAAMTSPKSTFEYYEDILDYIGAKTGRPVELVQRETYQEVNDLLETRELDMAFVCTGAYIEGHDAFGMEIVAAPIVYGAPVYYSYTIVADDSPVKDFGDLKGRSFAFTDPMSNTGTLVPTYLLGQMGETPDSYFGSTTYTYSHDRSIEAVADGVVDGAAVDSLIYDYLKSTGDPIVAGTRILSKSPPYGIPPVVVHPQLDAELKAELRHILLTMNDDAAGADILASLRIDRFEVITDDAYDSVRLMQTWLDDNTSQ